MPIPPPFIPYLLEHKAQQGGARGAAGELRQENDAVFTRPDGRPLDPRADWEEFKELLEEAGISDRRLYDGSRHTAGTILNELGVDMPTIMEILRHTQISQTRRYVKGRSTLSKDAMRRIGDVFLPEPEPTTETRTETLDSKAARARRRRRVRQKQKPQITASEFWGFHRAAFGIRTRDLRITSALLWPSELRRRAVRTMVRSATSVSLHSFVGCSAHPPEAAPPGAAAGPMSSAFPLSAGCPGAGTRRSRSRCTCCRGRTPCGRRRRT
ncbi:hypothetical protein SAVCW2_33290 [Streptomyces avermitilis]|uniref:Tyr recombinase domain-containing protein n=1 Tax=Streptomyces avermitilis TaxID=33903 RepID=A0A499VDU5_STRAX|nr:hypothetical protein SAVMC3_52940 [Streptomyces avermitilis]GDY84130.1 hypothetical protein SAVCW2_33290 [Streptomyces avermitilis]